LASGRRCSEIHSLSGRPQDISLEPDGSFTLRFLPEFLAKNQNPESLSPLISIKPLAPFLSDVDDPELLLCPVRNLRRYLRRSRPLRHHHQRHLFII
jgi:hypothetical protein